MKKERQIPLVNSKLEMDVVVQMSGTPEKISVHPLGVQYNLTLNSNKSGQENIFGLDGLSKLLLHGFP